MCVESGGRKGWPDMIYTVSNSGKEEEGEGKQANQMCCSMKRLQSENDKNKHHSPSHEAAMKEYGTCASHSKAS